MLDVLFTAASGIIGFIASTTTSLAIIFLSIEGNFVAFLFNGSGEGSLNDRKVEKLDKALLRVEKETEGEKILLTAQNLAK